jgi:hypothetical protein
MQKDSATALAVHDAHRDHGPLRRELASNPWAQDPEPAIAERARTATINGYAVTCAWIRVRLGAISGSEEIAAYRNAYKVAIV